MKKVFPKSQLHVSKKFQKVFDFVDQSEEARVGQIILNSKKVLFASCTVTLSNRLV